MALVIEPLITNGINASEYLETVSAREEQGWKLIKILPAKEIHPYAMETDWCYIFSKYVEPK